MENTYHVYEMKLLFEVGPPIRVAMNALLGDRVIQEILERGLLIDTESVRLVYTTNDRNEARSMADVEW